MEKPRTRALRRWRSFTKWMRRLKRDWNEHGWQWDPRPNYEWVGPDLKIVGWRSNLCECFDLANREATRFKDTPNGCNCQSCANPRRANDGRTSSALTLAERRAFLDDSEDWSKRKRRKGMRLAKVNCRDCGRQIGKLWVKNGQSVFQKVREVGWDKRCASCRKRHFERLKENAK